MRRLALLVLVAACGGGDSGPLGDATAHVTHYDYRFDLDSRAAHATVSAQLDTAGNCLTLPFRATAFDTATALVDGKLPVSGALTGDNLTLCGDGHEVGDTMTIDADMTVALQTLETSQVGYSVTMDAEHNPFYYLVSWVNGCDQFAPCDSRPDQFATYTFHVTHADTITVRCPGTITETSATETECDFDHPGGPTYSTFGIAGYPTAAWVQTDKGMWGSVHVTIYDRAATGIAAAIDPTFHAGFIQFMESTFGPFPFGSELRVLTAPTYWSGFEHPGNIVLDDTLHTELSSGYANTVQHVLDHEMTHQWAGDQTTIADTYDFVWKESMAEYMAYVYEDMTNPAFALTTASSWKLFAAPAKFFPVPDDKPALFDYYTDVYGPGPMVLFHQLEVLTSRAQVIAALQSVLGTPRALSVDELVAALSAKTGLDLTAYAASWIHGTGAPDWPRVALTYTAGTGGTSMLHVQQTNAPGRTCKFHVALEGAAATDSQLVEVDTFHNGVDQMLPVPTPSFAVTMTELDPLHECLVWPPAESVAKKRASPWHHDR
jgi:aminopeptidase N